MTHTGPIRYQLKGKTMQIYFSPDFNIHDREVIDLYKFEQAAGMYLEDERFVKGRHGGTTYTFKGYGGDEHHSARRPNDRGEGAQRGLYAATWDQWGILLGLVLAADPSAKVGGYKRPYYDGLDDFNRQTDGRFEGVQSLDEMIEEGLYHGDHRFRWTPAEGGFSVGVHRCTKQDGRGLQCSARMVRY